MYPCCLKVAYLVYSVYFLITPYFVSSWLYTCILIIYKFFISIIIHMIPFTFYLTPILHRIYSLSISSYDASLQAHDHSLLISPKDMFIVRNALLELIPLLV